MVSQKLFELCTSNSCITSELTESPRRAPGDIVQALCDRYNAQAARAEEAKDREHAAVEDLDRARRCGRFGSTRPSVLFLHAFNDVLNTLEQDPMASGVFPPLVGTTGTVPFTIIGPLIDIARHMSNMIVRASKEILLATNYWVCSKASQLISEALRELSRRAQERGDLVAVRIMYDRGNAKQLLDNHQIVSEEDKTSPSVKLPPARDIPNVDLQVVNFHRPIFGTFHSKYMIVDRQVCIVQSNNIQDNANIEMMTQLEGEVVNSLWEAFLASWQISIGPLPCAEHHVSSNTTRTFQEASFRQLFNADGSMQPCERHLTQDALSPHMSGDPHYDADLAREVARAAAMLSPRSSTETGPEILARNLNQSIEFDVRPSPQLRASDTTDYFPHVAIAQHEPVPMAIVSRKSSGAPNRTICAQNEAFLSLIRNAARTIFIQTPNLNAAPLHEALLSAVQRGIQVTYYVCLGYNDAGELLPGQNGTNEMFANSLFKALRKSPGADDSHANLRVHYYVAKDQVAPIHDKLKLRSCHIKLMIVDEIVAVQGSSNQDSQSWWQSQELNVMIDSPFICRRWREAIERNQNTGILPTAEAHVRNNSGADTYDRTRSKAGSGLQDPLALKAYGRADDDGCWRDARGELAEGSLGNEPGSFSWARGMVGAYRRAKGQGGF